MKPTDASNSCFCNSVEFVESNSFFNAGMAHGLRKVFSLKRKAYDAEVGIKGIRGFNLQGAFYHQTSNKCKLALWES